MIPESLDIAREQIEREGYHLAQVELPAGVRAAVVARDWAELDLRIAEETRPGGVLYREMARYARFESIEFIISIRSSLQEPDEDGIWHDDGSRVLAFTLSLTLDPQSVGGGRLEFRRRGRGPGQSDIEPHAALQTPPFGTMIVFATGHLGFEHRICRVSAGERIIIAGWCS